MDAKVELIPDRETEEASEDAASAEAADRGEGKEQISGASATRLSDLAATAPELVAAATALDESANTAARADAPSPSEPGADKSAEAEPIAGEPEGTAPTNFDRLHMIPWARVADQAKAPTARSWPRIDPFAAAAAAAVFGMIAIGAFAAYDHARQSALVATKTAENAEIGSAVAALKGRIEAIENERSHEELVELRRTLGEIKSAAAAAREYNGALTQISQRVDRIEKDQGARFDKLGERVDRDSATRFAEIAARLERLEKKTAPAAAAAAAPPAAPPAKPAAPTPPAFANVSNDTTASIERPKTILRGYELEDIRNGMAIIDSREGQLLVGPGDVLPGAGRVLRIERRGRDWAVVTTQGLILTPAAPY